jgi:hypothetical protein
MKRAHSQLCHGSHSHSSSHIALGLLALASSIGCAGRATEQAFPPGLEPLEDLRVSCPDSGGASPETIEIKNGESEEYDWTHGCGIVAAPIADVLEALRDTEVAVDQRSVDEWVRENGGEPEYDYSFTLQNTVHDIITVDFETSWRLGFLSDEKDEMTAVGARYQMTIAPPVIDLMEGSVEAVALDDDLTELRIIDRVDALRGGTDITELKVRDLYEDVLAHVNGQSIPSHRD